MNCFVDDKTQSADPLLCHRVYVGEGNRSVILFALENLAEYYSETGFTIYQTADGMLPYKPAPVLTFIDVVIDTCFVREKFYPPRITTTTL